MPREAPARVNVHAQKSNHPRLEPELVADVEYNDDGDCQDLLEKVVGHLRGGHGCRARAHGRDGHPELSSEDKHVCNNGDPGANDTSLRSVGQLIQGIAGGGPRLAEANVAQTDAGPGEETRQPADAEQPVENGDVDLDVDEVGQEAEAEGKDNGDQRPALAVDVAKDARSVGLLGEGGEDARRAKDGRVADAEHGEEYDGVHDAGEDGGADALDGEDKGARRCVDGAGAAEQARVVVRHEQADEEEGDNVEDGDAPEDLLDGAGQRLARVGGLGGGEADELGADKGKGRRDEHAAEALEAVAGRAGLDPVLPANVAGLGRAANVDDDAEEAVARA